MLLKQTKILDPSHPDFMKLRRGIVEKSLWATLIACFLVIGLLIGAVFYYKLQIENTSTADSFSKIGARYLASVFQSKMNDSIDPCEDFYMFACGRFVKTTIIPDDAGMVNTINMIEGKVMTQLHTLLNNEIREKDLRPFKMVKQFYRQCMNTTQIEKTGTEYVERKMQLKKLWPVIAKEWTAEIWNRTDFHKYNVNFFLDTDLKNTSRRTIYIGEANIGLSRDMLLNGMNDRIVQKYLEFMINVGVYFGADRKQAEEEFKKVVIFEMELANISMAKEDFRDANKLYNPVNISELISAYPFVDWVNYINSRLTEGLKFDESDRVIVQNFNYFNQLEEILNKTEKRTIANHVIWRELAEYLSYLTNDLREMEFEFYKTFTGRSIQMARWHNCIKNVAGLFNIAVSSMYVREHFKDERIKQDISDIVSEISKEFEKLLHQNTWMDSATKEEALRKLHAMNSNIAYPNELLNDTIIEEFYKYVQLNQSNYLQSAVAIDQHSKNFLCRRFHQPVNRNDWIDQSSTIYVNANYHGKSNSIQILSAILQGHFYAPDRPFYMNYASIGYVIGHEITHAFDDLGRLYDLEGNLKDWWDPDTAEAFTVKKQCFIEQFGNYTDKTTNMSLNGYISQGENIADSAGLKLAYRAYTSAMNKLRAIDPTLPGMKFTSEQLFWLSAAQTWCSVERPEVKRISILTDNHALAEFRVIGTLSNSYEFARDFNCQLGSPMNPERKCEVW